MHFGWNWGGNLGAIGIVELVVMALFWGLIVIALIAGIRWLIRAGDRSGSAPSATPASPMASAPPAPRPDDPLEILRQRYARGEIDDDEYERRRKTLTGS
jgi:putative membrane protein